MEIEGIRLPDPDEPVLEGAQDDRFADLTLDIDPSLHWIISNLSPARDNTSTSGKYHAQEVARVTRRDLINVPYVGALRAERAFQSLRSSLQASMDNMTLVGPPTAASEPEDMSIGIDPNFVWMVRAVLPSNSVTGETDFLAKDLAKITLEDLKAVKGVGHLRAERTLKEIQRALIINSEKFNSNNFERAHALVRTDTKFINERVRSAAITFWVPMRLLNSEVYLGVRALGLERRKGYALLDEVLGFGVGAIVSSTGLGRLQAAEMCATRDIWFDILRVESLAEMGKPLTDSVLLVCLLVSGAASTNLKFKEWENAFAISTTEMAETFIAALSDDMVRGNIVDPYVQTLLFASRVILGETLEAIGNSVGLTRERIRQRVSALGVDIALVRSKKIKDNSRQIETDRECVVAFVRSHPGCTALEIAVGTGMSLDRCRKHARSISWLVLLEDHLDGTTASELTSNHEGKNRAILSIQDAATYVFPLTFNNYTALLAEGAVTGPSGPRIHQLFGTWKNACNAAGVEPGKAVRNNYESAWTDMEILSIVAEYLIDPAFTGSHHRYDEWKRQQKYGDDLPSGGTISNRISGSWSKTKISVLMQLRKGWAGILDE